MEIVRRKSCRALLITPHQEILLAKLHNHDNGWIGWITPGGGMDPGETEEQALRRELREELGLAAFSLGPKVWSRFNTFPYRGKKLEQAEAYFLIHTEKFDPVHTAQDEQEKAELLEIRWWKITDLLKTDDKLAPTRLAFLLDDLNKKGPPSEPIDVGV